LIRSGHIYLMTTFREFIEFAEAQQRLKPVPFPRLPWKANTGHTSPVKPWKPNPTHMISYRTPKPRKPRFPKRLRIQRPVAPKLVY